jgi:hypothetical protein
MSLGRFLKVHRNWEDWAGMLLGIVVGLSPWLSGQMGSQAIMVNAIFAGAIAFVLAEFELADLHRWEEVGEIAVGSWLIASPFIFGYSADGPLRVWHFVLGAIIVLLALLELWQDWGLKREELARHGE